MLAFTLPVYSDQASPNFFPFLLLICRHLAEREDDLLEGCKGNSPEYKHQGGDHREVVGYKLGEAKSGSGRKDPRPLDQQLAQVVGVAHLQIHIHDILFARFLKLTNPHQPETIRRRPLMVSRVWRCARLKKQWH